MTNSQAKFIVILGATATGKTELALQLGERLNGEVICADSRTIYREMNIGTAKPTAEEQVRVRHHLLDVIDPGERLSAAAFKMLVEAAMADISRRGKLPIIVGGSGLYIDAVLYDYQFPPEADPARRAQLEALTDEELLELLAAEDSKAYETVDRANRRRVIRAIETAGTTSGRRTQILPQALVLGKQMNKKVVQRRVEQRVEKMLEEGFMQEVRQIGEKYGWDSPALDVIGYRAFKGLLVGTKTLEEAKADFARGDMALYKKQVTWFKRNPDIRWVDTPDDALKLAQEFLAE
ncbi:MAG: tRNA (adenosine(37)-N6)-dimethylallyltransferase MiaA [Candidatus Saccharimonadales bacterium]